MPQLPVSRATPTASQSAGSAEGSDAGRRDPSRRTEGRRRIRLRSPRRALDGPGAPRRCAPGPRPGAGGLSGGYFALRGPCDAGEHRGGIAVQDLLARFLADLRFRERLFGPVAAELGAVGATYDALGAVEVHGRLDRAGTERVAIHVH